MKKSLVYFLLIILAPSAFAKSIVNDWYYSGDFKTVGDVTYHFQLDNTNTRLAISSENEEVMVRVNESVITDYFNYTYAGYKPGRRDYVKNIDLVQAKVVIQPREPDIALTLETDEDQPYINDRVTVRGTITNEGNKEVDHYNYVLALPRNLNVESTTGCRKVGGTIAVDGSMLIGDHASFTFEAVVSGPDAISLRPVINYSYGIYAQAVNGTALKITVLKPFSLKLTFTPASIGVGNIASGLVTIKNTGTEDMDYSSFLLTLPEGVSVVDRPDMVERGRTYSDGGSLEPQQERDYTLSVRPLRTGSLPFFTELNYNYHGTAIKETSNATLQGTSLPIVPRVRFRSRLTTLPSNTETNIQAGLFNSDKSVTYHELSYAITSELFDEKNGTFDFFVPQQDEDLLDVTMQTPFVDETVIYNVTITGRYRTAYFDWYNISLQNTLKVTPIPFKPDIQVIRAIPSAVNLTNESNYTVATSVKNTGTIRLDDVLITDEIDGGTAGFGTTKRRVGNIEPGETKSVYQYRLVPNPGAMTVTIKTIVTYWRVHDQYRIQNSTATGVVVPSIPVVTTPGKNTTIKANLSTVRSNNTQLNSTTRPPSNIPKRETRFSVMGKAILNFLKKLFGKKAT